MPQLTPETALLQEAQSLKAQQGNAGHDGLFPEGALTNLCGMFYPPARRQTRTEVWRVSLLVPYLKKGGGAVLKLIKSGEDWHNVADADELYGKRVVAEDVSNMPTEQLEELLDKIYREANPDEEEEEG